MSELIPTPGRIVYVRSNDGIEAGIITKVHSDELINVMVFPGDGRSPSPTLNVPYGEAPTPESHTVWHWMPYQVQQAKTK